MDILRYGSKGPMTEYLQLALTRAGFNPGPIDGIFGRRTLAAVESFQKANGLDADGIVGRMVWAKLFPYLTGYTIHVVKTGETLDDILKMHGSSIEALRTANPDLRPDALVPGTELIIPLSFPVVSTEVSYSYAYTMLILDGLAARYPYIHLTDVGASVMGKRISCASIGTGQREVFYNASHHANEWITTPVLLKYLEDYASAYASGGMIGDVPARAASQTATLYLIPLVNPDGVDLVTGALPQSDSYYLKAQALSTFYPSIPFPEGWKANINGVDLNLGYPANWERARQIKFSQGYTRPGPRDYVGSAPLAEPENRAVYDFTKAHNFSLTLSYHTQGEVIFWKYLDYEPEGSRAIGETFARVSGYALEETPYESGFAGYKDWFIQEYNRPGYTIEAGRGESPLPLTQFPEIYRDNLGILSLGMVLTDSSVVY